MLPSKTVLFVLNSRSMNDQIHGILPVYKPIGISSFDIIRTFKKYIDDHHKIGHAGTLDVFASGVLILLLGKMTKEFAYFQTLDKEYLASVRLGYYSNSLDVAGMLMKQTQYTPPPTAKIKTAMQQYIGTFDQLVPAYSASKQDGRRLYQLAREGKTIKPKIKEVTVHDITLEHYKHPLVTFRINCASGTYIRQLTYDILKKIEIESFVWQLERTRVGEISIDDCAMLKDLETDNWKNFLFTIDQT